MFLKAMSMDSKNVKFREAVEVLSYNPVMDLLRYAQKQSLERDDMIHLVQGEGSLVTPDFIADAAKSALDNGLTFYAPVLGHELLREEIAAYYERIYGCKVPKGRIFVTSSGMTAMHLSLEAVLSDGDEVVAVTPVWKNLLSAIALTNARCRPAPLDYNAKTCGWSLDLEKLFATCGEKTRALLIVTPSNPTGWVASDDEIKAILEFARAKNIWVIADEVYGRIVYEGVRAPSFLDHAQEDDRLLVVNSFSKAWAMTGWRLGWIVGPRRTEQRLRDLALYDNMGPNSFIQHGGIAALRQGEDFIAVQIKDWRARRDMVVSRLNAIEGVECPFPESTFYAFFRVNGEPDCIKLCKRFIDEARVSLAPGIAFGEDAKGFIRLCFAVDEARLSEALDRIEKVLKG